jgi:alpha-beta hydrolase superfamily lysophospholipase
LLGSLIIYHLIFEYADNFYFEIDLLVKNMKRGKIMIVVLLIFLIGMAVGYFGLRIYEETDSYSYKKKIAFRKHLQIHFENPFFSTLLLRRISYSASGGADIGECISISEKIKEGDPESWYDNWMELANRINNFGKICKDGNDFISANECFLRSSNYFQSAESILPNTDQRKLQTFKKSREVFLEAMKLFDFPFNQINIPYENTALPAFIALSNSVKPTKTIIINTGFDGSLEEEYFTVGFFALRRGYNVIMFEGPGQGMLLREEKLSFRPDWEKVIAPILDFAENQNYIDKDKIALYGRSFGGYLTPRAAAYDKRIKALVVNSPIIDSNNLLGKKFPENVLTLAQTDAEKFDKIIYRAMAKSPSINSSIEDGMWKIGSSSPSEWINVLRKYDLKEDVERISCPTLVVDSEKDDIITDREIAKIFFCRLKGEKEMILFTEGEGAGLHCQMGSLFYSNEMIFNWLDKVFSEK